MRNARHAALAEGLGEMSMFENVTESRDPEESEMAEREEIAASKGVKQRTRRRKERWRLKEENVCLRDVQTHKRERDDYSDGKERKMRRGQGGKEKEGRSRDMGRRRREIRREKRARRAKASQMLASARRWNVFKTKEGLI